ncbi:DUF1799 domain-containing protein [Halomonas sp. HMF6819]|uniref:DUF1799 domain-containing protein n=1 Tax=Halomonas sp. HMF6819 TaxID=3373085 RepID=UPI00378C886D
MAPRAAGSAGGNGKKLNALGRAWAGARGGGKNELDDDLAAWGIKTPERFKKAAQRPEVVVWPWNAEAFDVFRDCASQWRYLSPPMASPVALGIERSQLESTMRMLGVKDMRETLRKVQHIEAGALEVMKG